MVCAGIESLNSTGITDLMSYPTTCFYHFWAIMMAGFFLIVAINLYNRDKEKQVKPDWISSFGVAGLATIFVSLAGTAVGIISRDVFIEIMVACLVFVVIWIFKK